MNEEQVIIAKHVPFKMGEPEGIHVNLVRREHGNNRHAVDCGLVFVGGDGTYVNFYEYYFGGPDDHRPLGDLVNSLKKFVAIRDTVSELVLALEPIVAELQSAAKSEGGAA